jgi:hypothetical protein
MSKPQGLVRSEGLRNLVQFRNLLGSRNRAFPAYITVPQLLCYRVPQ